MPRSLPALLLAVLFVAGCFSGPGPDADRDADPDEAADLWDALPCDAPAEPDRIRAREMDLAADPNDPQRLAAGIMASIPSTRPFPPDDEPVWIRVLRSSDGGQTWRGADLPGWPGSPTAATSPFGGSLVTGDPVVAFLPDGTLLLAGIMIRADYSYVMFSARFEGESLDPTDVAILGRGAWGDPALADVPSPGTVLYNDKEELAVDPVTGTAYVSWMWRTNNPLRGIQSVPVVSMSTDGGRSWTAPTMVAPSPGGALTSEEGHVGQFPFITVDGQVHIAWFAYGHRAQLVASAPVGTVDFGPPRVVADGVVPPSVPRAISIPLPSVAVGPSPDGAGESVYIVWADARLGTPDILLARSDDGAATWTEPLRVNPRADGDGSRSAVPVVAVSATGRVGVHYITFTADASRYDAWASLSDDAGGTFTSAAISAEPTYINRATGQRGTGIQAHVGDYFGAAFTDDAFVAMWQDGREGSEEEPYTSTYVCRLPLPGLGVRAGADLEASAKPTPT